MKKIFFVFGRMNGGGVLFVLLAKILALIGLIFSLYKLYLLIV